MLLNVIAKKQSNEFVRYLLSFEFKVAQVIIQTFDNKRKYFFKKIMKKYFTY
jgi:hypothetical protein